MGKWVNVKQKPFRQFRHIHPYFGIFRHIQTYLDHNQAYSGISKNYSGIIWTLCNPAIFRTLVYSKPDPGIFKTRGIFRTQVYPKLWHIQNQRHNQNLGPFRTLGYSEPWDIQNRRHTQNVDKNLRWSPLRNS